MKVFFTLLILLFAQTAFSQTTVNSKKYGELVFNVLDFGLAKTSRERTEVEKNSPTGDRGWLKDFEIIEQTDSIKIAQKANFGVVYRVDARETVDIKVVIEWIYPSKIINEKGEVFKSIKYATVRPTNTPSASSYSLDESYEMLKGNWEMNIYLENKKIYSKTFVLY